MTLMKCVCVCVCISFSLQSIQKLDFRLDRRKKRDKTMPTDHATKKPAVADTLFSKNWIHDTYKKTRWLNWIEYLGIKSYDVHRIVCLLMSSQCLYSFHFFALVLLSLFVILMYKVKVAHFIGGKTTCYMILPL